MNKITILLFFGIILLTAMSFALSVDSVRVDSVAPGEEGTIKINVENDGNQDAQRISFRLQFPAGIIPIGSSEAFVDEIKEDDEESFGFGFKVANTLPAG